MTSDYRKLQALRHLAAKDAERPEVQALASNLWAVACASRFPRWAFVELAQCVARDLVRYVTDTERVGREQIDGFTDPYVSPLAPLERGVDDCDAKARLFVALCLARRIAAEIVPRPSERWVKEGAPMTHVSARVWVGLPKYEKTTKTLQENAATWHAVETILARAKVAERAEHVPRETDTGSWLFS